MKNLKIIFFVLLIAANYSKALAQKPAVVLSDKQGWHKIGENTVSFNTDKDEIMVIGANKFSSLQLKVTNAPVNLKSFDIYFDKGDKQSVSVSQNIKDPGETRVVKLEGGGERVVRKVILTYNTATGNSGKKAHVEIWGLKTNTDKKDK
ncbi:DUF2541 family protein [Flavobacterium pectinovorum]|jgi:hypothetical protein|uniref:DUF2541 family protein n=1 Tax=Flavobacterium pectinovorum TaxID=29533 RepID=A0A502E869_9FLAO|nr:DUF2541 family protein [Flavobacterium pectinovorum]TPG33938.1 DUF2541 family protein [Flavobacterium pectinovorum]